MKMLSMNPQKKMKKKMHKNIFMLVICDIYLLSNYYKIFVAFNYFIKLKKLIINKLEYIKTREL